MMEKLVLFLILFLPSLSLAVLQPGTPEVLSASNSATYRLSGFCDPGGVDVEISFGSLTFSAECNGVTGTYNLIADVSSETATNPIQHCVSQPPTSNLCSRPVDNRNAPPSGSFDLAPLTTINSENQTSYSISGLCAPSGASLSLAIDGVAGVLTGTCRPSNLFSLNGDVSAVSDGTSLVVSLSITSGSTTTISNTVGKDTALAFPFPVVTSVYASFSDADSDTWLEANDAVIISVQFSENVNLSGAVELNVALSSGVKSLSYLSGSGSNTINFNMPILVNDEQCNGLLTIRGMSLNGGSIVSVDSGEQASFSMLDSTVQTAKIDAAPPTFPFGFSIDATTSDTNSSPEFIGQNLRGQDGCVLTNFQAAVGETIGGIERTPYRTVPPNATSFYQIQSGVDGYNFSLEQDGFYYVNLRARDAAGGEALASSPGWSPSPVFTMPDLILYLDGMQESSILDGAGRRPNEVGFSGFVRSFLDISNSATTHNFLATATNQRPAYNVSTRSLEFDRSNDCMGAVNHPRLNTGTVNQRSFSAVATMGTNTIARQMIYEMGTSSRGMNIYIDGGMVYCGLWNVPNDGDGAQAFVSRSAPILPGQTYDITSVFDYKNYAGAAGPDGTFRCYLNGAIMTGGPVNVTSRLFASTGDVQLGCNGTSTLTHTGADSAKLYSGMRLKEFVIYGERPDAAKVNELHNFWTGKWGY